MSFIPIPATLEDNVDIKDLSSDQKYLFDIHKSVSEGKMLKDLANRSPGNMNHERCTGL